MLDLHTRALEKAVRGVNPARARAVAVDGRLFLIEMMGYLADRYRLQGGGEAAPGRMRPAWGKDGQE